MKDIQTNPELRKELNIEAFTEEEIDEIEQFKNAKASSAPSNDKVKSD
jgi:hypothetical protein